MQSLGALIWSFIAVFPILLSGAAIERFLTYFLLFGLILLAPKFTEKFRKIRYLSESLAVLFCGGLLIFERSSLSSLAMRVVLVLFLLLAVITYCRPLIRRIVVINFAVLFCLLIPTEIGFRFVTNSQSSSQFQIVDLFRNSRPDGPAAWPDEFITSRTNGLRTTTDQPASYSGRVLIFGGSTTFCAELPDFMTYSSILQRLLNDRGAKRRVENYGKSAATSTDRVIALEGVKDLSKGDIVIFYIGVNEAGVGFTQRELPAGIISKVPEIGTAIQKASRYSRIADVLFRKLVFGSIEVSEQSKLDAVQKFQKSMDDAQAITDKAGAFLVPVLQANLFTRNPPTVYDIDLGKLYGSELSVVVRDLYSRFRPVVSTYEYHGDATAVMNNLKTSPYFDWHHANAEGNRQIAEYLKKHLVDMQLIE